MKAAWVVLIAGVIGTSAATAAGAEYAVVASADVEPHGLTMSELRRVFLLERRFWRTGEPIVVLLTPGGSRSREALIRQVCRTDEGALRRSILEKIYRGEIDLAPKVTASEREAVSYVAASRGVIALVPLALVPDSVRVLAVDGRLPGTAGYLLRD